MAQSIVEKKIKKLSVEHSDFIRVKEEFHFVDKSLLIKDVIDNDQSLVKLILRPRGFGKSLNMSMLEVFFSHEMKDKAHLFHDLKIWQQGEWYQRKQGQYPVIFLSFDSIKSIAHEDNNVNKEENSKKAYESVLSQIRQLIANLYQKFEYLGQSQQLTKYEKRDFQQLLKKTADEVLTEKALARLIVYLGKHHKKKVVVLIDEYDTLILDSYEKKYYDKMASFISNFLGSALNEGPIDHCEPHLQYVVMTGVLQIGVLNNLDVCSVLSESFDDHFGFTEAEVTDLLNRFNLKASIEMLRHKYGGYRIGNTMVLNPWSIVSFFNQESSSQLLFGADRIKAKDVEHTLINQILKELCVQFKEDMKQLIEYKSFNKSINENVALRNFSPLTKESYNAIWSLLLLSGYLTVSVINNKVNDIEIVGLPYWKLVIPNQEVYDFFQQQCLQWFPQEAVQWRFIGSRLQYSYWLSSFKNPQPKIKSAHMEDEMMRLCTVKEGIDLITPLLYNKEAKIREEAGNRLAILKQLKRSQRQLKSQDKNQQTSSEDLERSVSSLPSLSSLVVMLKQTKSPRFDIKEAASAPAQEEVRGWDFD